MVEGRPLGVEPICSLLQVAPSTYYAAKDRAPSARALRDAILIPQLVRLWDDNYRVYGVRKLWKAGRRAGIDIGRDQTGRLMRAAGMEGATRSKRVKTTKADPVATRHPDLVKREFTATAPNRLWVTDLTFVPTWARWSRGHHHGDLRCHSDAGSQFTSIRYGERLAEIGATPSIGTVGDSFDNALAETVNGYYKTELVRGPARSGPWKSVEDPELATLGWVHWHNTKRLHGYLGDIPPAEFEQAFYAGQTDRTQLVGIK